MAISVIVVICTAIELLLEAADLRLIGHPIWRNVAYAMFGFHGSLLHGAHPIFPLQPYTQFLTYAFLHGGLLHLVVNMLTLVSIGLPLARQAGNLRFLIAYFVTAIGGAALFALIGTTPAPMVGASGALFGLLGVWICWGYLDRRHYGDGMYEIYRALLILVAYNVVFYVLLAGHLAWETHLGGFIAGWCLALYWGRPVYQRQRRRNPDA